MRVTIWSLAVWPQEKKVCSFAHFTFKANIIRYHTVMTDSMSLYGYEWAVFLLHYFLSRCPFFIIKCLAMQLIYRPLTISAFVSDVVYLMIHILVTDDNINIHMHNIFFKFLIYLENNVYIWKFTNMFSV